MEREHSAMKQVREAVAGLLVVLIVMIVSLIVVGPCGPSDPVLGPVVRVDPRSRSVEVTAATCAFDPVVGIGLAEAEAGGEVRTVEGYVFGEDGRALADVGVSLPQFGVDVHTDSWGFFRVHVRAGRGYTRVVVCRGSGGFDGPCSMQWVLLGEGNNTFLNLTAPVGAR